MTQPSTSPALRVDGPADLISAVPYLLGFHPHHSVVVVGLHQGEVVVTIRVDLDELVGAGQLVDAVLAMQRGGASEYIAVVFDDRAEVALDANGALFPWRGLAEELIAAAQEAGGSVSDALLVSQGRYRSYLCTPDCCPPQGRRLDEKASPIAAAATYAGLVALPDRDAVGRLLDPRPSSEREGFRPALAEAVDEYCEALVAGRAEHADRSVKRRIFAFARAANVGRELPGGDQLARLGVALRRIAVRDAVWMAVDDRRLDGDLLWRHLARELPSPYDAAPLFLTGWHAWRAGDGALARIAVERALASDPAYSAADLLMTALNRAVDPRTLPRIRTQRRDHD
jgi:hypothetical protein